MTGEEATHTAVQKRRRFPLLPDGPLGWTPYAWLLYIGIYLIEPIARILQGSASTSYVVITVAGLLLFVAAYFRGYWVQGRQLVGIVVFMVLLACALLPINGGAVVMFVYAGAFAGYMHPQRTAIRALLVVTLIALAMGLVIDARIAYWITTMFILLVGGVNLHFSQAGRVARQLRLAQDEIQHLAAVAERERIARDLHDVLGHTLSLIVLKSELAARILERDPARAADEMRDVEDVARRTLQEVRETLRGYRATLTDEVQRAGAMLEAADVRARFDFEHLTLERPVEEALALALREAVTNVARHADASSCAMRLYAADGAVVLEIHDDGRGTSAPEGGGLRGMRERIEACGGHVQRQNGDGTRLRVEIPLSTGTPAARAEDACAVHT